MAARSSRPLLLIAIFAASLALSLALALWMVSGDSRTTGSGIAKAVIGGPFELTDHTGRTVTERDLKGRPTLLFFGFTHCPDVCPTTLAELHAAVQLLGERGKDVQVMMITVDPDRDTLQVLAEYMPHFDANFLGLTGTPEQIAEIATYYGVAYERSTQESALGYLVNHTATVATLDRQGYVRVIFPFNTPASDIAADVAYLLNR